MRVKPGVILITILMALLPAMIYLSFDFGITCDERLQDARGKSVLHFYYSGLKAADLLPSTRYYGSFVDTTSVLLQRFLGFLKPHETRHVLACIFGWLGIVFTALLARKLFGIEAAFFSVFFLLVSPRYFGHSMNNSKDIPFAALFVASLSFICSFNNRYPFLTPKAVAVTALTIGLAIAVRPAGIILFLAAGLLLFGIIYGRRNTLTKTQVLNTVLWYVALILGAVAIAALFWPTLVIKPLSNVVSALQFNAQFPGQRKELFNRSFTNIAKLPWYYLPVWLGITAPPAVLFSFALSPILLFLNTDRLRIGLLYFSILFPFVVALIARSPLYD
ncbi:MAG: glycosyltransferase family 39 protein, partial [Deltaproteobacteria bacterium]|nr:glycosyltransferase family 39 protein [Deltaproteobacteria bacterium]